MSRKKPSIKEFANIFESNARKGAYINDLCNLYNLKKESVLQEKRWKTVRDAYERGNASYNIDVQAALYESICEHSYAAIMARILEQRLEAPRAVGNPVMVLSPQMASTEEWERAYCERKAEQEARREEDRRKLEELQRECPDDIF